MAEPDTGWDWRALESRPPAFRPDDLRFAGDLCSDPVTRAIRHGLLSFASPAWCDDLRELPALAAAWRPSNALKVAIGRGALPFADTPDWCAGRSDMERVFALKRLLRIFRAHPSAPWTTFTEPQLTRGLAYFLNAPEPVTRIARIRALLTSLGAAELGNDMSNVRVTAEAPTARNKRIDLLIEWTGSSQMRYAAVIEAKFGHAITSGQLPAYRAHLRKIAGERRLLAVVSPRRSAGTDRALRRNREWRWIAWRDLLLAHERVLPLDYDDEEYLRFRRTLWDQTG